MIKKATFFLSFIYVLIGYGQTSKFKVVLDAGHGGKDYGAVYHGNIEKNIALKMFHASVTQSQSSTGDQSTASNA